MSLKLQTVPEGYVDKPGACRVLGVSGSTLNDYIRRPENPLREDCRVKNRVYYDPKRIVEWRAKYVANTNKNKSKLTGEQLADGQEDFETARTRKMTADANRAELRLKIESNEVVSVDKVVQFVSNEYSALRTKLLSMPVLVAPYVAGESDATVCQEILDKAIRTALLELTFDTVDEKVLAKELRVKTVMENEEQLDEL